MFGGRRREAGMLLDRWVDTVLPMNDAESILLFARRQLAKKRFWTTAKFLERCSAEGLFTTDTQFEAEVLRCTALHELYKLMLNPNAIKGLSAETEADWVRCRTGPGGLEMMLADSLAQARRAFGCLTQPTESQLAFNRQLDKIAKEMTHTTNSNP